MKNSRFIYIYLLFNSSLLFAQSTDCEMIVSFINDKEKMVDRLNLHDPDFIPLHYLVANDLIKEVEKFNREVIPYYTNCAKLSFGELINRYDNINKTLQIKYDSLCKLNQIVYLIFYEKALYEYQFNNETDGDYYLQRSLQYNATFPNAILLKLNKFLDRNLFKESLSLLHTLYYETQLDDEQEKQAIDFTDKFYDKLYQTGDSLLRVEHAAEALALFEILEQFCQNLPTAYCNDDYYHGVLRSQAGIYDSYLAIAKVAEQRENPTVAALFYQYAQEYLESKPYLQTEVRGERREVRDEKDVVSGERLAVSGEWIIEEELIEEEEINEEEPDEVIPLHTADLTPRTEDRTLQTADRTPQNEGELKEEYDKLVLKALALCLSEDFETSFKLFKEAKVIEEECKCFTPDFRVDLMLKEFDKYGFK